MNSRSFLFLQGVASPFFLELGKALTEMGHDVLRINFCGGDCILSKPFKKKRILSKNYRDSLDSLPGFIETVLTEHSISDIVLFGDTRPVHQAAIKLANQKEISTHVYEEGYLRPGWITLDKEGVNANSKLSKDPNWYRQFAKTIQANSETMETGKQLRPRALHDMRYHFSSYALKRLFPHYRTHRPETPLTEYIGWIKRFPHVSLFHKKPASKTIERILNSNTPFYVLPLQLNADAQMKHHSPLKTVVEVIQSTLHSFAQYAPADSLLVIKNHPLDTGFVNYPAVIKNCAIENNVASKRIIYLETGDLNALLEQAKGTVLVNSTVGMSALELDCPTFAIGTAIYDMQGLTYQGELDNFWQDAYKPEHKPDPELFRAFRNSLIALNQINGDFYTRKGIKMAVSGSLHILDPSSSEFHQLHDSQTQSISDKTSPA